MMALSIDWRYAQSSRFLLSEGCDRFRAGRSSLRILADRTCEALELWQVAFSRLPRLNAKARETVPEDQRSRTAAGLSHARCAAQVFLCPYLLGRGCRRADSCARVPALAAHPCWGQTPSQDLIQSMSLPDLGGLGDPRTGRSVKSSSNFSALWSATWVARASCGNPLSEARRTSACVLAPIPPWILGVSPSPFGVHSLRKSLGSSSRGGVRAP